MDQAEPSAVRVGDLVIAGRDLWEQIAQANQFFRESFEAILTPEQIEKLQRFRERRGGRRGFRRGPPGEEF